MSWMVRTEPRYFTLGMIPRAVLNSLPEFRFSFSTSLLSPLRPAPMLGEHTKEALGEWLGLSEKEIRELKDQGALT